MHRSKTAIYSNCCSSRAKGLRSQNVRVNQGEFAQHFHDFAKMTFAGSSPLSPATQSVSAV
jgi:hypothetical protein